MGARHEIYVAAWGQNRAHCKQKGGKPGCMEVLMEADLRPETCEEM